MTEYILTIHAIANDVMYKTVKIETREQRERKGDVQIVKIEMVDWKIDSEVLAGNEMNF